MDTNNFNNDKLEVPEKFEAPMKYEDMSYMEDISQSTYDENDSGLLASSAQSLQTKNYLARKTVGVQKRKNNTFVPTVPKPFKFHTASRVNISRNEDPPRSPFIPLAVKIQQFMEKKPSKFDTKAASKANKVRSNTLTVPRSPYLRTKYRSKPTAALPTEEREVKEIQNHRFKANTVDRKIFENEGFGIPKVQKPKLTVPNSPFITKPKPPRSKSPSPPHVIKANPAPDCKEPYRPVVEHRLIDLPNFSLPGEEISKRKSQEIEERIRQEKEELERMREFRAQPLPANSPDCLPPRPYYSPTHPKPFTLLTDYRGEKYQKEFHERLRKEHEHKKEIQFYAQPLPSFEPETFKKPECPPPTDPVGFYFFTDVRMEERNLYDEQRRLRDKEAEEQREQKFREEEARQAEEIRRLRVELVHHAQPIRHYSPIIIQPSNRKPTRPISPMIGEKRRKYIQILNNYDYSFGESIFDLGNTDNVGSLDQILYSSFESANIDQITTSTLTPIAESDAEFQDIIMTDNTTNSEQVQEEDLIINEVTSMTDEIDLNKMQN